MSCVIPQVAVTFADLGKRAEFEVGLLHQRVIHQLKNSGLFSVEKSNAGARHAVARGHQRLEMKTGIYDNLRLSQPRGEIQFPPYAESATGKNGFATRVIAMQPFCNLQNALEVFPQRGVTAVALRAAKS